MLSLRDKGKMTPFMLAVSQSLECTKAIIRCLSQEMAAKAANAKTERGKPVIHLALRSGKEGVLEFLLSIETTFFLPFY